MSDTLTPKPFGDYTKGEQDFITERAKQLLTMWADHQLVYGSMPSDDDSGWWPLCLQRAQSKGWVSADGTRVLAQGFKTAAAFLRR